MSYVVCMGLRCFLPAQKETKQAGKKFVIIGPKDNVRRVFFATGFDMIAMIRDNIEDALASLG